MASGTLMNNCYDVVHRLCDESEFEIFLVKYRNKNDME